ncbi:hypothetical protein ACIQ7S_14840, partial [Streptomyces griseoluteus]|uniref:hypothetical protein n=1 Tax=Streptomyces griseoluteus TaxID=29306 RepID=UPI0038292B4A
PAERETRRKRLERQKFRKRNLKAGHKTLARFMEFPHSENSHFRCAPMRRPARGPLRVSASLPP